MVLQDTCKGAGGAVGRPFEMDGIKARDAFHDIGVSHTHICTFFL
jgi:hypothetical protein